MNQPANTRSGFIALAGRPNVGKSTLLNYFIGSKVSITCDKPQTTRHRILGIKTAGDSQYIFVDTPGIHRKEVKALNKRMNKAALGALHDVDVIVFVCEARGLTDEDKWVLEKIFAKKVPVIAAINKVDKLKDKEAMLPVIAELNTLGEFADIVPIAALKGKHVDALESALDKLLPEGPWYYDEGTTSDKSTRFQLAEIMREKLMRFLGQELPYATTVQIEKLVVKENVTDIRALIWVERDGQKAIILGKNGEKMKQMATEARLDMEALLGNKVMLRTWVKVKESWTDDELSLNQFGYDNED